MPANIRRRAIRLATIGLAAAGVGAFVLVFGVGEPIVRDRSMRPPEDACPRMHVGPRQCEAIVAIAIERAGLDPNTVVDVAIGRPSGERVEIGGMLVATARLHLASGGAVDQEVWCTGVGGATQPWCTEDPLLQLWMGANQDVPCRDVSSSAATSVACATSIVLDPEAVAAATPLRIAALDIPLAVGPYRVELGRATLANGYLDEAEFSLADPAPDGVVLLDGVRIVIEPTDPSRPPLGNVYDRGLIPGVEPVVAYLEFHVIAAPVEAVLQVRDVVVR